MKKMILTNNQLFAGLLLAPLLFLANYAQAVNLGTIDPSLTGNETLTISCTYPIAREDNTPLAIGEIAKVNFFVEKDSLGGFLPAGENATQCQQVYDLTQVVDGVYVYAISATDTDGRESLMSPERVTLTVKRLPHPKAPTDLSGSLS